MKGVEREMEEEREMEGRLNKGDRGREREREVYNKTELLFSI